MEFVHRPACRALADAVELLWWSRDPSAAGRELALPTGESQLFVQLADEAGLAFRGTEGVLLQGPASRPAPLDRRDQRCLAGVAFRPGGLRRLLGPAVGDLADAHVALEQVLPGVEAARIRARLLAAPTPLRCLEALEAELLALAIHPLDPRLPRALARVVEAPVGRVAAELGLSDRRLTVWFTEHVGLAPKRFARVRRFQRALDAIFAGRELGEVAYRCGYYDQAHLDRDFRAFTGICPTAYRARRPAQRNHLPDVGSVQAAPPRP